MRLEFVRIFIDSTTELFQQMLGSGVDVSSLTMRPGPEFGREVMAVIGLTGEAQGRVILDMDLFTAVQLSGHLLGEPSPALTPMVRSSIAELSSMAIGRAISRINEMGTRIRMSPPTVITGANMTADDHSLETLVVPINTAYGEVRVSIVLQDLD